MQHLSQKNYDGNNYRGGKFTQILVPYKVKHHVGGSKYVDFG